MIKRFVEGNLLFKFGARWTTLFRWDRHVDFTDGMSKTHEGKAVDFVGVLDGRVPFLIEVKDFRYYTRDPGKIRIEHEFELKIRATVAALYGVRWQGASVDSAVAFESLRVSRKPRLVLWHEEARSERGATANVASLSVLMETVKANMHWIDAATIVTSTFDDKYNQVIPDLEVADLPLGRKQKAEEVVAILQGRNMKVEPRVRWRIDDCETEEQLDDLICRAATVRDPWKLVSHLT